MEPTNLHPHHKVQEQYVKYSSLVTQTIHQVSTTDEWNPNLFSNIDGKYNRKLTETIPKSWDLWPPPLVRTSINQDSLSQQSASEFLLTNIKDEMSDSFPKLSEMMYCYSSAEDSYIPSKKHYPQSSDHDLGGNLWNNNFSIANNMRELQLSSGDLHTNGHDHSPCLGTAAVASRYDFNHIFPSTNISTSDLCPTLFSSSLDLNLKSLDLLLTSKYDDGNCNQTLLDSPRKLSTNVLMGHDHRRERRDCPSTSSKVSAFVSGSITSTKGPGGFSETKESYTDAKKHRSSMTRSPCPTLKVRKEKLRDRVAALQKLVTPFGKTDTACVLTEAIGYIQFLHDKVLTLNVPFMKSSHSKLL